MTSPRPNRRLRGFTLVELPAVSGRKALGFTLVELLAVIAIIGIMIAVLVPSFAGFARGSKMTTAVTQLRTTMSLARQHAITKRETTYVVFPNVNSSLYADTNQISKACHAYNVYGERSGYLREWISLPEGIVFVPSGQKFGTSGGPNDPDDDKNPFYIPSALQPKLPFPGNSNAPNNIAVIEFKPDGSARSNPVNGNSFWEIYLAEGWASNGLPISLSWHGATTNRQLTSIEVFALTGQIKVNDYSVK